MALMPVSALSNYPFVPIQCFLVSLGAGMRRRVSMRLIVGAVTRPFAACGILPAWQSINLRGLKYCVAILFVIMNLPQAYSKDMQVLIRILDAAFAAEQMSTICMSAKINLSENDKEVFKSAVIYSQGVRRHVIAGLSVSDVDFVLKSAADQAKALTEAEIAALATFSPALLSDETQQWCANKVKPSANQIIGAYMRNPEVIEQLIAKAKAN
jgi:hypothetical protein